MQYHSGYPLSSTASGANPVKKSRNQGKSKPNSPKTLRLRGLRRREARNKLCRHNRLLHRRKPDWNRNLLLWGGVGSALVRRNRQGLQEGHRPHLDPCRKKDLGPTRLQKRQRRVGQTQICTRRLLSPGNVSGPQEEELRDVIQFDPGIRHLLWIPSYSDGRFSARLQAHRLLSAFPNSRRFSKYDRHRLCHSTGVMHFMQRPTQ